MRIRQLGSIAMLLFFSAMVGCGSGAAIGTAPPATPGPSASPTSGASKASPSPIASAGATATATASAGATGAASPSVTATATAGASAPSAAPSPTARPITTPIAVPSQAPTPSPSPTQSGYTFSGITTCTAADETIPGTYTTLDTNGNVVGNTYTEDTSAINSYLVNSYAVAAATAAPTAAASATPLPTPAPGAPDEMITVYFGEYSVPAFVGVLFPNVYQASATTGCFMLALQQPAGGTAGQARRRRDAAGSDNTFGIGVLANPASSYTSTDVDAEALNSLTITNLTATTGAGTFALSNGTNGTLTITGSGTIIANQASSTDRTRNPAYLLLRALMEQNARNPFER